MLGKKKPKKRAGGVNKDNAMHSAEYWESRYSKGGDSGSGSYGRLASFKAQFLNDFVQKNKVKRVIELGCGDGNQLKLAKYPKYVGLDVSRESIKLCKKTFKADPNKSFFLLDTEAYMDNAGVFKSDLAVSLDVIFHLVEDQTFETYLKLLFGASSKYVIIYASNYDQDSEALHVKHRKFTPWIENNLPGWELIRKIENKYPFDKNDPDNTSFSDFYVYQLRG